MGSRGRKYREAAQLVDRTKNYSPSDAIELVRKTAYASFDSTVELHLRLGVDPRHADQQVRGVVLLPQGTGKEVRILVFAEGDGQRLAEEGGADFVGSDELVEKVRGGWLDFDVVIATPPMMRKVSPLGRVLGPRGLMPNPKAGTIVKEEDLARVIEETRQGRVEFRVDRTSNLHIPIGKVSFSAERLMENLAAVMETVVRARPAAAKGSYVRKAVLTATMGPGIKVDPLQLTTLRAV